MREISCGYEFPSSLSARRHRLNVLRALISEINNAAKTPRPIDTDQGLYQLIRKRTEAVKTASEEYVQQKRDDLKEQADTEISILQEYSSKVQVATAEEIQEVVSQALGQIKQEVPKPTVGHIMKFFSTKEHSLKDKVVEGAELARIAKEALAGQ